MYNICMKDQLKSAPTQLDITLKLGQIRELKE